MAKPRAAAKRATKEFAATLDTAAEVGVVEALVVAGEVAEAEPEAAEPVAVAEPGLGWPKRVTADGTGATSAEAEAPMPTKLPTFCPGRPFEASAAA